MAYLENFFTLSRGLFTLAFTFTLTFTHIYTHIHTHIYTHIHIRTITFTPSHSHSCTLILAHSHSFTLMHTHSLLSHSPHHINTHSHSFNTSFILVLVLGMGWSTPSLWRRCTPSWSSGWSRLTARWGDNARFPFDPFMTPSPFSLGMHQILILLDIRLL